MTKKIKKTTSPKPTKKPIAKKAVAKKKVEDGKFAIGQKIFLVSPTETVPTITEHTFRGYRENKGWGNYDDSYAHLINMHPTRESALKAIKISAQERINDLNYGKKVLLERLEETDRKIKACEQLLIS